MELSNVTTPKTGDSEMPTLAKAGVPDYSGSQLTALTALRMLVGWHLLYEGITKLLNPYWTSAGYLAESEGIFSGIFQRIATTPSLLAVADGVTQWGLMIIGAALMVGLLTRTASVAGMTLLLLFYLCAPPLRGYSYSMPTEGSYLVVNKTLIEAAALFVLWRFPTGRITGLDALWAIRGAETGPTDADTGQPDSADRAPADRRAAARTGGTT